MIMMDCATFVCFGRTEIRHEMCNFTARSGEMVELAMKNHRAPSCHDVVWLLPRSLFLNIEKVLQKREAAAAKTTTTKEETHSLSQKAKQRLTRRVNEQKLKPVSAWEMFEFEGKLRRNYLVTLETFLARWASELVTSIGRRQFMSF